MDKTEQTQYTLHFFRSKYRTQLLIQFMLSSQDRFFMRELERLLKIPIGSVRRELIILERDGIVKSEKVGNLKFYSLDKENPFYQSLKDIVIKTVGIPNLLENYLSADKNIVLCFIYGSYAKGNFQAESDIDLFIITNKNSSVFERINSHIDKLEQRFNREINVDIMLEKEFMAKVDQNNSYINDITTNKKIFIKGGENELRLLKAKKTISGFQAD